MYKVLGETEKLHSPCSIHVAMDMYSFNSIYEQVKSIERFSYETPSTCSPSLVYQLHCYLYQISNIDQH